MGIRFEPVTYLGQESLKVTLKNRDKIEVSFATLGGVMTAFHLPNLEGTVENVVFAQPFNEDLPKLEDSTFGVITMDDYPSYEAEVVSEDPPRVRLWREMQEPSGVDRYPAWSKELLVELDTNTLRIWDKDPGRPEPSFHPSHFMMFNLSGDHRESVKYHELFLRSSAVELLQEDAKPSGELRDTWGTAFEFRYQREIGEEMSPEEPQFQWGEGFHHGYLLTTEKGTAARITHRFTGRTLEMETSYPFVLLNTHGPRPNEPQSSHGLTLGFGALPQRLVKAGEAEKIHSSVEEPLLVQYRFKLETPMELPFLEENCPDSEQNSTSEEDFLNSLLPRF
jgi:aldose 1-epimerase